MKCSRPNCNGTRIARGLCTTHYQNIPKGYVDAAPAKAHYEALRATGMGVAKIAELSGLHRETLRTMGQWRTGTVQVETERKLLAIPVPPRPVAGGSRAVDATGTRRRLQALGAIGWPLHLIAAQMGRHTRALAAAMDTPCVLSTTAAAVADVFDRLQLTPGPSEISRSRAARKGFPPPLAWDEDSIDDPNATPAPGWNVRNRRAELLEDVAERREQVRRLTQCGLSAPEIADRLGVTPRHVERYRRELGRAS